MQGRGAAARAYDGTTRHSNLPFDETNLPAGVRGRHATSARDRSALFPVPRRDSGPIVRSPGFRIVRLRAPSRARDRSEPILAPSGCLPEASPVTVAGAARDFHPLPRSSGRNEHPPIDDERIDPTIESKPAEPIVAPGGCQERGSLARESRSTMPPIARSLASRGRPPYGIPCAEDRTMRDPGRGEVHRIERCGARAGSPVERVVPCGAEAATRCRRRPA